MGVQKKRVAQPSPRLGHECLLNAVNKHSEESCVQEYDKARLC